MIRIGILNCDALSAGIVANFGDYPRMFKHFLDGRGGEFEYQIYNVLEGSFPAFIADNDAYLITGSKSSAYHRETWIENMEKFIRTLASENMPIIGICFGHQIIAQALGGGVAKSEKGWGVGVRKVNVLKQCDWMQPPLKEFSLLYSHQDQVVELPPNAVVFAGDEFCPCAGMFIGQRIITFQGHPEFEKDYLKYVIGERRNILGENTSNRALRSLLKSVDKRPIRQWLDNFLNQFDA